jgi:hypothetical protein
MVVYRLRVIQNRGLRKKCGSKRVDVIGSWRTFHKGDPFITCIPHRNNSDYMKEEEIWLVWREEKCILVFDL